MMLSEAQGSRRKREQGSTPSLVSFSFAPLPPCSPASFLCRPGCGACCIVPSISSPIPGMPDGKPAGVRCVQLTDDNLCKLFGLPERPAVCVRLRPSAEMCGRSAEVALIYLHNLEVLTQPNVLTKGV